MQAVHAAKRKPIERLMDGLEQATFFGAQLYAKRKKSQCRLRHADTSKIPFKDDAEPLS